MVYVEDGECVSETFQAGKGFVHPAGPHNFVNTSSTAPLNFGVAYFARWGRRCSRTCLRRLSAPASRRAGRGKGPGPLRRKLRRGSADRRSVGDDQDVDCSTTSSAFVSWA